MGKPNKEPEVTVVSNEVILRSVTLDAVSALATKMAPALKDGVPVEALSRAVYLLGGTLAQFILGTAMSKNNMSLTGDFVRGFDNFVQFKVNQAIQENQAAKPDCFRDHICPMKPYWMIDVDKTKLPN